MEQPGLVPGELVTDDGQSRAAPQVSLPLATGHPRLLDKDALTTPASKKKATPHEAANDVLMNSTVNTLAVDLTRVQDDIPDTAVAVEVGRDGGTDDLTTQVDEHRAPLNIDKTAAQVPGLGQRTVKMDGSQQTPTQVNEDRDYTEFCEPLPSSPTDGQTQHATGNEPQTLNPDDTGAVNFGNLSEFARPSSQISEDGGFENTRGGWRRPDDTSQLQSNHGFTPFKAQDALPPETPALPKNPFGTKSNGAVPFGGTQLFGQTQMLSSAVKIASPTSSRPSPNVFLNSISPNIMETSPLKNRANVSSPTDIRTSSPTRLHEIPATLLKDKTLSTVAEETPVPLRSQKDDRIPESPTYQTPRPFGGHQPMAHYVPMKQSQERKTSGDEPEINLPSDSDSDDALQKLERKKRVERKRAQAAAEMNKVSFMRTQRRLSDEQPGRKRRKLSDDEVVVTAVKGGAQAQLLVRDSQKAITQSAEQPSVESTKATPGEADEPADSREGPSDVLPDLELQDEEMIPATSPIRSSPARYRREAPSASEPELPTLRRSGTEQRQDDLDSSSLPPMRRRSHRTYGKTGRESRTRLAVVSSAEDPEKAHTVESPKELADEVEGSEDTARPNNAPPSSYSEPPVPMATRSRRGEHRTRTPRRSKAVDPGLPTSSSLTNLSGTPLPSSKTTPGTQESHVSGRPESVNLASPGESIRSLRKRPRNTGKSESPPPMTKAMRLSRRAVRVDSDSTDELHGSPSATALDRSTHSKSARSFRTSLAPASRSRRLFDGMVFALSFSENQAQRTKLESKITQAGGMILHEGFQELFEQSTIVHTSTIHDDDESPLRLTKTGAECGFCAVIADSHSRKAKYMQALALGLPCLAPQWASTCLKKGEIIDWTPYLLCAGASQVLGNAIRSRTLAPYPVLEANLSDTIATREKLLDGEKLLIVMDTKKSRKETKQQYLFLALALGPSLTVRVTSVQQAGEIVRHAEQSGSPFGWIYVDSSTGSVEAVLSAAQETGRKKKKVSAEPIGRELCILTDELVIQSLILGRMVDATEME